MIDTLDDANRDRVSLDAEQEPRQNWHVSCSRHGAAWYCVQTEYGKDATAIQDLTHPNGPRKQRWEAFCPEVYERRTSTDRDGRERTRRVLVPMFPGYIFVRFDIARDPWRKIVSAKGVARILGAHPERPTPLRSDLIIAIASNAAELNAEFQKAAEAVHPKGAALRVTKGPWAGFQGVCLWHKNDRIKLMMTLFGQDTATEMPAADVEVMPADQRAPEPVSQWRRKR
nr:transcription termination/antitermination NusG family protein [uncultured Roseococcus sp.]